MIMSTKAKNGARLALPAVAIVTIAGIAVMAACGDDTGGNGGGGGATASSTDAATNTVTISASQSVTNTVTQGMVSAGGGEGGMA